MKGKSKNRGSTNPMFGKRYTPESIEKMRQANIGRRLSKESIEKIRIANLGRHHTEETRTKMRKTHTGMHNSLESIEKIRSIRFNENNPFWKGDKVGIDALHAWVGRHKIRPELCEECKEVPPYDLTNISGQYRRDIDDFKWLCRRCHMISDGRINNLKQYNKLDVN